MGCFGRAMNAAEETKFKKAEEKVQLAVIASQGKEGKLDKDLLKENVNSIEGLEQKVSEVTYDLTIKVDGYEFKITELGKVTYTGKVEIADKLPENTVDTEAGTEVALKDGWGVDTVTYYKAPDGTEVTGLTKVATVYAVSVGNGNTVPVPKDFYYVGGTIDKGVVISDNPDDKNKYKGQEKVGKDLSGNQFVWIPCSISNYKKITWGDAYKDNTWDNTTPAAEKTQIQKYGGFYVGRYEAGTSEVTLTNGKKIGDEQISASSWKNSCYVVGNTTDASKPTSKANEIPYFHADFTTADTMSQRMYNTNYVNSGLITGTQWDVMINWMSETTDKSDLKANCDWGNYNNTTLTKCEGKYCKINKSNGSMESVWQDNTGKTNRYSGYYALLTTGSTEEVGKKNIYDVAGNLWEWSQESVSSSTYYMLRGGSFRDAYASCPACYRSSTSASSSGTYGGFRVALYIK